MSSGGREDTAKFVALLALLLLSTLAAAMLLTTLVTHADRQFVNDASPDPTGNVEPKKEPEGNREPEAPQPKPWRIFHVHWATALTFDCAGDDVPAIHVVPSDPAKRTSTNGGDVMTPASTCGGRTLTAYKLGDEEEDPAALHVLFLARHGGEDAGRLVPAPKAELRMVHKLLATLMEKKTWNPNRGMFVPEYLPFSDDTVVVYCPSIRALMVIGRDDMEFQKAPVGVDVKIRALTPGTVI